MTSVGLTTETKLHQKQAASDEEMGFEEGKEFSHFICGMKLKRRNRKIFY